MKTNNIFPVYQFMKDSNDTTDFKDRMKQCVRDLAQMCRETRCRDCPLQTYHGCELMTGTLPALLLAKGNEPEEVNK